MNEHIENNVDVIDVYNNLIHEACSLYDIDVKDITPMQWEFCMRYIYKNHFKNTNLLRAKPYNNKGLNNNNLSNNNAYNIDTLYKVYLDYIDLCTVYNKVNFVKNYLALVGIDFTVWERLRDESEPRKMQQMSGGELYKRVQLDCEQSLVDHLMQDKTNPLKAQTVLNNRYGWSTGRTITEQAPERIAPSNKGDLLIEFAHNAIEPQDDV